MRLPQTRRITPHTGWLERAARQFPIQRLTLTKTNYARRCHTFNITCTPTVQTAQARFHQSIAASLQRLQRHYCSHVVVDPALVYDGDDDCCYPTQSPKLKFDHDCCDCCDLLFTAFQLDHNDRTTRNHSKEPRCLPHRLCKRLRTFFIVCSVRPRSARSN